MSGSSTTLTTLRDLIATTLATVSGLTVYKNGATSLDNLPAVEMMWPDIDRVPVDEPERELGAYSWDTSWPMTLSVSADDVAVSGDQGLQMIAQIVAAFDANLTLGTTSATGFSLQCALRGGREVPQGRTGDAKPTRRYEMTLDVQQLV